MALCYRCQTPLTRDKQADEHIIINACGGRLKSRKLICKSCNSSFGNSIDAELARQTNDMALMLMIKRENGEPQPMKGLIKSTGQPYQITSDGSPQACKPSVELTPNGDNIQLSITARDEKEFRHILKGIKRKHPSIDIESISQQANREEYYLDEPISFSLDIGGHLAFRAITKSLINYYLHIGGHRNFIKHLIPFIDCKTDTDVVWFHYPEMQIYSPEPTEVSHIIHVVGDADQGLLYGYIELFNTHCYLGVLSTEYDGPMLQSTYVFNVLTRKVLERPVNLFFDRSELIGLFDPKPIIPVEKIRSKLVRVFSIGKQLQTSLTSKKITDSAIDRALSKFPDATIFTSEILKEISNEIANSIAPFIVHTQNSNKSSSAKRQKKNLNGKLPYVIKHL